VGQLRVIEDRDHHHGLRNKLNFNLNLNYGSCQQSRLHCRGRESQLFQRDWKLVDAIFE